MNYHSILEKRVAEDYESAGYEVRPGDGSDMIETPTGKYQPNLIALRGDETVVVEVLGENVDPKPRLRFIAEAIRSRGWRFDVVHKPQQIDGGSADVRLMTTPEIDYQLVLLSSPPLSTLDPDIGLLVAWRALEALLMVHAEQLGADTSLRPGQELLKNAATLGLIDDLEYAELRRIARLRAAIVHGNTSGGISSEDLNRLLQILVVVRSRLSDYSAPDQSQ